MAPVNQPKDKKHERAHEYWSEEAKPSGKRKLDCKELENEPLARKLFLRKTSKPLEKIGNVSLLFLPTRFTLNHRHRLLEEGECQESHSDDSITYSSDTQTCIRVVHPPVTCLVRVCLHVCPSFLRLHTPW